MRLKTNVESLMSREEFEHTLTELNAELGEESGNPRTDLIVADDCDAIPGKYLADYLYNPVTDTIEVSYEILISKFPFMTAQEIKRRLKQEIAEEMRLTGRPRAAKR